MIEFLKEPLVGSILGISGIIIGTSLAIFFYFKSKIISKPKYVIENINLIDLNSSIIPKDVLMMYKDKQIIILNKTTIRFWNAGKKTIDKNDLVPEYLVIDFEESSNLISLEVSNKSRDVISIDVSKSKSNKIEFSFNYLDYKDFFEIEIIHTGEKIPSKIIGNIKGVPKGITDVSYMNKYKNVFLNEMIFESPLRIATNLLLELITRKK